jgi:phosphate transport system permease protein
MKQANKEQTAARRRQRIRRDKIFVVFCIAAASLSVVTLIVLLSSIIWQGRFFLSMQFLTSGPSRFPEEAGIYPAMFGTIFICAVCACFAIPLGVGTAVLLEEFRPRNVWLRKAQGFVQLNITNLAGVPSVVYGILGLSAFVQMFGWFGSTRESTMAIGQTWYDYAVDEGGQSVFVRVDGRNAPPIELRDDLMFLDGDDAPIRVQIVAADDIMDEVYALEDAIAEMTDSWIERVEDEAPDDAALTSMVNEGFASTALMIDTEDRRRATAATLIAAREAASTEQSRLLRELGKSIEGDEKSARFARMISDDTTITRTDRKSWYFFQIPFGRGVFAGGLTLLLVVLPVIIIASQESIRAVPDSLRQGALALGSTRWQMIRGMTLPAAIPGIMTGTILAMSRAIGEAAPMLIIAGVVYITFTPSHLMDDFTAMPLQIFEWASRPQEGFHRLAASGIIVLLAVLMMFNAVAIYIRNKFQKPLS